MPTSGRTACSRRDIELAMRSLRSAQVYDCRFAILAPPPDLIQVAWNQKVRNAGRRVAAFSHNPLITKRLNGVAAQNTVWVNKMLAFFPQPQLYCR